MFRDGIYKYYSKDKSGKPAEIGSFAIKDNKVSYSDEASKKMLGNMIPEGEMSVGTEHRLSRLLHNDHSHSYIELDDVHSEE